MNNSFALLFFMLILMASCTSYQVNRQLKDIESYIQDRPDSALCVLENIDRDNLRSPKNKAYHALLHAMALDKNYIDVTDDSLSRTALNYFDKWGPKKYKARALYYLGVYYYNIGENKKAILEFTKSEDLARKAKDGVYLYLSLSTQSDTYSRIYNDVEQENCLLKATEVVEAYDLDKYRDYVDLSLAQAYINTRNIEKSSEILNKLINRGNTDSVVVGNAISSLAFLKMVQDVPDPEASAELFSKVYEEYGAMGMKLNDFWAWATALHMIGNIQAADELITQLDKEADIPQSYYWKYKIAKNNDDFENAFNYLEKAWDEGGEEVNLALRQSLSRYQRDYYEAISLVESNKATKRSYIIIICSFIALFIFLISNIYINRLEEERIRIMRFAEEMSRIATEEQTRNNALKKRYISLYQSKFDLIRSLCYQYFVSENRVDAEKLMYGKVASLIKELRCDKKSQKKMEKMLDHDLDGIMTNLRSEMPKLKELDYILFSYMIIGFDAVTISQLTGVSDGNIYAHKRRIRLKIQNSHPPHEEQFLEMLS